MTWLWRALPKSFKASSDRTAQAAGTICEPGNPHPREEPVQVGGGQPGEEQEQAAELGAELARRQVEPADIGHLGDDRARLVGPFVVEPPRQLGEALLLQDRGDGRRAERFAVAGQGAADVVDGEVLLAQGDDLVTQPSAAWPGGRPLAAVGTKKSRSG